VLTSYSYDNNDRVSVQGDTSYSYDENGNTLGKTVAGFTTSYSYSVKDKLVAMDNQNVTASYQYNIDGIRIAKIENSQAINFLVDQNRDYAQVIAELDNTATVRTSYTYGDDLLTQNRAGKTFTYHYDGLGSTRLLTDEVGVNTDSYNYEAFGETLNKTGTTKNSYLYTGEQYDSNLDNYYLRARYYDQNIGRFTQQDTWMGSHSDPVTLNKYLYAHSSPSNYTDPSGHFVGGISGLNATIGIGAILAVTSASNYSSFLGGGLANDLNDNDLSLSSTSTAWLMILSGSSAGHKYLEIIEEKTREKDLKYVAKPAEIVNGHIVVTNKKLTFPEALSIIKFGDDVIAKTKDWAYRIASSASGGGRPIGPERHLPNQSASGWPKEKVVYRWHYHTRPRNGAHIFY